MRLRRRFSLVGRILAILDESPLPVPTPDIVALCNVRHRQHKRTVWGKLLCLERKGLVRRVGYRQVQTDRLGARTVALWARA
jgi:repressor of nif and glnA expression